MIVMENQAATNSLSLSDDLAAIAARLRRSTVLVRGRGRGASTAPDEPTPRRTPSEYDPEGGTAESGSSKNPRGGRSDESIDGETGARSKRWLRPRTLIATWRLSRSTLKTCQRLTWLTPMDCASVISCSRSAILWA